MKRKVAITGMSMLTALGLDLESSWQGLVAGRSGVRPITAFDASKCQTQIAANLPGDFDAFAREYCNRRLLKQCARATVAGYIAAQQAIADGKLAFDELDKRRCAVVFGAVDTGHSRIGSQDFWVLKTMPHGVTSLVSMQYGLEGPSLVLSAACASSAYAIIHGGDLVASGKADVAIVGGASAIINPEHVDGFNELGALSVNNAEPERASRPFSLGRDGFVIGEGAGALVLETLDAARARGAKVYAELAGGAMTNEAYNLMGPRPEGQGMAQTMQLALEHSGIDGAQVDYVNAHGTSTMLNDKLETMAIKRVLGERANRVAISASKSMIGHTAAACGAIEAVITALSIDRATLTPTINFQRDPELDLDYVPNEARRQAISVALSNSFGFGGCNASLVLRRVASLAG